jgi:hypothetical protein
LPKVSRNVLRIALVPWAGRAPDGSAYELRLWDFLIDDRPLAEHLGLSRAGLALCGSSLEGKDRATVTGYAEQLLGAAPGGNQFESGRVVLYRCHCGCDYCGVISARVVRESGSIRWIEVGYEDDGGACGTATFRFRTRQAVAAVAGYLRRRSRTAIGRGPRGSGRTRRGT